MPATTKKTSRKKSFQDKFISVTKLQQQLYEVIKELNEAEEPDIRPILKNNQIAAFVINPEFMDAFLELEEKLDDMEDLVMLFEARRENEGKRSYTLEEVLAEHDVKKRTPA